MIENKYDIVVIGGGHAGIEAAAASSGMGLKTALITMNKKTIGKPSCNPSIGGTAKGHLVKEIDALGGVMGILADKAGIHFKILNKSKGPAVWSPRCQIDKDLYPLYAFELLSKKNNLTIIETKINEIVIQNNRITGVKTFSNDIIKAQCVILCAGTFLNGLMHTGNEKIVGGRTGEPSSDFLSDLLVNFGFEAGRLKTGTPPRVYSDSIDYSKVEFAFGDEEPKPFSHLSKRVKNSVICYSTKTNQHTHDILKTGFDDSPMFTGRIKGIGPRYCPSIEDKVNRFSDRDSHKILLEPEGLNTKSVYINGFSTSLPKETQELALRSIPGLEECRILKYGYAIEYDFFFPYQLKYTLETKKVDGLFFAGQINGTSGYEEAASQGLIAGINASLKILQKEPIRLKRSDAYIGVLIDDLVNKSTEEPYRIFTSLAEYRLLLRQDNADERLMHIGYNLGLISSYSFEKLTYNNELKEIIYKFAEKEKIKPETANKYLQDNNETIITDSTEMINLAKRSNLNINNLLDLLTKKNIYIKQIQSKPDLIEQLQTEIKYEGYINRQKKEIEYLRENENKIIPETINYDNIVSLSNEGREKLKKIRPSSLGQASRISGVSSADVSIINIYLKS